MRERIPWAALLIIFIFVLFGAWWYVNERRATEDTASNMATMEAAQTNSQASAIGSLEDAVSGIEIPDHSDDF